MHLSRNKKLNIYFYFLLLILLSTIFNQNFINFFKGRFKITNINLNSLDIEILEIGKLFDVNIYSLNKEDLTTSLNNYNIIKHFEIKKIYPNTLDVKITKSKPIALISDENKFVYFGDNEKLFESFDQFDDIPKIVGSYSNQTLVIIFKLIKKSSFKLSELKEIKIYPTNRFDFILKNKKIIKFPINTDIRIIEFAKKIYETYDLDKNIIDLRLPDKVIIRDE